MLRPTTYYILLLDKPKKQVDFEPGVEESAEMKKIKKKMKIQMLNTMEMNVKSIQ